MKIIFLDIDGVLNNTACLSEGVQILHEKVLLLDRIIEATDARVVISSSWRMGRDTEYFSEILRLMGCWRRNVLDLTPEIDGPRGGEIQAWLDSGLINVTGYLILDDDGDMLDSQKDHFIQTDVRTGLMSREIPKAIAILNRDD